MPPELHFICIFTGSTVATPVKIQLYPETTSIPAGALPELIFVGELPAGQSSLSDADLELRWGPLARQRLEESRHWPGRTTPGRAMRPREAAAWMARDIGRQAAALRAAARARDDLATMDKAAAADHARAFAAALVKGRDRELQELAEAAFRSGAEWMSDQITARDAA